MPQQIILAILAVLLVCATTVSAAPVKTGAEMLSDSGFAMLRGKRFGLVTNQSATVRGVHILDLMAEAGVPPTVIFAPEHGLKGKVEDGERFSDATDNGIPVRSLYGGTRKPRPEDLHKLDLLLFDIQDVGARFYTYISTMGLVMQAAAEAGIPLVVLDRPNPLGGTYLAGFVREGQPAFTSLYPIPVTHGMTVGELARLIKGAGMLPGLAELRLSVVKMAGWERWMRWPDTGLDWVATSPNIPDFQTALLYPGICLLEGTVASEGRGTPEPFRVMGLPGMNGETLAASLNRLGLPGVTFAPARFTPVSLPGRESFPKCNNRTVDGVRVTVTNYRIVQPVETGVAVVSALYGALQLAEQRTFFRKGFDVLAGSLRLRQAVAAGSLPDEIAGLWEEEIAGFSRLRKTYLLYEDGEP